MYTIFKAKGVSFIYIHQQLYLDAIYEFFNIFIHDLGNFY